MRMFEIVMWCLVLAVVLRQLLSAQARPERVAAAGALLLAVGLHAVAEGVRAQMAPLYFAAAIVVVQSVRPRRRPANRRTWRLRTAVAVPVLAYLAAAGAIPLLFPVYKYEPPTGPYAIGTANYQVPTADRNRTLVVQVWYPATPGTIGRPVGLTTRVDSLEAAYSSFTGLPRPLFDNLRLVRTHAIDGVPIAEPAKRRPIVLFSHGPLSANRVQSVFQMEALASHGFVVAAIDHTGYASTTVFPDGHTVGLDPSAAWPVFVDQKSTAMLETWVQDVKAVIDRLAALDAADPDGLLTNHLDLARLGYVGASFGGSVVVQALLEEPRIKAGVAQDGKPYFVEDTPQQLNRPLMYMQSAAPYMQSSDAQLARWGLTSERFRLAEQDHYRRQMRLFGNASSPIYNVYLRRTDHVTFSDLYLIVGVPTPGLMDIRRAHRIINDYTTAFFERYLNGKSEPLVDDSTPSPYPEVTVARRNVAPKV